MALYSTYADLVDFLSNMSVGTETASLVGGNTALAAAVSAGATSFTAFASAGFLNPAGQVPSASVPVNTYLLDGANSENASVASITGAVSPFTFNLAAGTTLQAAHNAGINVASAGTQGCLADILVRAAAWVESICKQGPDGATDRTLYAKSRVEKIAGPSQFRAAFDPDGTFILRPYHWPVTAVATLTIQMGAVTAQTIDLTFLQLPDAAKSIRIPAAQALGTSPPIVTYVSSFWPRNYPFMATLTYTGGPIPAATLSSVPADIRQATQHIALHLLAYRRNPYGAADIHQGDFSISARLRGDTSGKSLLLLDAERMLEPYMRGSGM